MRLPKPVRARLVELAIVAGIIGVLAAIAVPRYLLFRAMHGAVVVR